MQLTELNIERNKMITEKVNLENQLEAEQEYILNKLHKQVGASCTDALHCEHMCWTIDKLSAWLCDSHTQMHSSEMPRQYWVLRLTGRFRQFLGVDLIVEHLTFAMPGPCHV